MYLNGLNKYNIFNFPWYAVYNQIMGNPEFDWWACKLLKRSELLIGQAKRNVKHCSKVGFYYGIIVPHKFKEAIFLDE